MLIERHNSSGAFFDYGPISFCLLAMLVANKLARNEMNRDRESMNRAAFQQILTLIFCVSSGLFTLELKCKTALPKQ